MTLLLDFAELLLDFTLELDITLELDEGLDPSLLLRMTSSMLDDESPSGLTKLLLSSSPHAARKSARKKAKTPKDPRLREDDDAG